MLKLEMEPKSFTEFFDLLQETEPIPEEYDVEWWGPYFIQRSRSWLPTHFMLYGATLYGSMEIGWSRSSAAWNIKTGEVSFDRTSSLLSPTAEGRKLWERAIPKLVRKLEIALKNPETYNRRVLRLMPLEARTGRVLRRLSWPRGGRAPLAPAMARQLETACREGALARPRRKMSANDYLKTAALAYDAGFKELHHLSPRAKYERKADSRHGGLLDLSPRNSKAFHDWYSSRAWSGSHPWEIVFGHPHGVLFSPLLGAEDRWRFHLSVDAPGWYLTAARMAIALGEAGIPFEFYRRDEVVAALRGRDFVPIGPHYGQLSLAELQTIRPEALAHICWDPIPEIHPIKDEQRRRLQYVLKTGSPGGWI